MIQEARVNLDEWVDFVEFEKLLFSIHFAMRSIKIILYSLPIYYSRSSDYSDFNSNTSLPLFPNILQSLTSPSLITVSRPSFER